MDPSLAASPEDFIKWCLEKSRPTRFFTSRLGLPQTEHSKSAKGRPDFEGDAADQCKALYKATHRVQKRFAATHFRWKKELRDRTVLDHSSLTTWFIDPLLEQYGRVLWPASSDTGTHRIDPEHYPRKLIYNKDPDRGRLTLYLYGWIVARLARELPTSRDARPTGEHTLQGSTTAAIGHSSSDDEDEETIGAQPYALVPSAGTSRQRDIATNERPESSRVLSEQVPTSIVPVAQMLPMRVFVPENILSNGSANDTWQDHDEDTARAKTNGPCSDSDEYQPRVTATRRIKRRGDSIAITRKKAHKRVRYSIGRGSSAVQANDRPSYPHGNDEEDEEAESVSNSSPVVQNQTRSRTTSDAPNFPNIPMPRAAATTEQPAPTRVTQPSEVLSAVSETLSHSRNRSPTSTNIASAEHSAASATNAAGPDEDADSVIGDTDVPRMPDSSAERTWDTPARPSLVVPMRFTTQRHDAEVLRKQLASKLGKIRRTGLCKPDILLLKSTVELLETLSKASHLRLREIYTETFNHYQEALSQWLQLLKDFIVFYEVTGFKGGLSERDAFLQAMPEGCPLAVEEAFIDGSLHAEEWLHDCSIDCAKFAQEVASLLFYLGWWPTWTKQANIEKRTAQFTQDILAWYGLSENQHNSVV